MTHTKIESGYFLKRYIEANIEYKTDATTIYYLILWISENQLEIMLFKGSPPIGSNIINYNDVIDTYSIEEIPEKEIKQAYIYRHCKINNLDGKYQVAINYKWSGKEFIRKLTHKYWTGYKGEDNTKFWNTMEDDND